MTKDQILHKIEKANSRAELLEIDHSVIPAAGLSAQDELECDRAVEARLGLNKNLIGIGFESSQTPERK